MKSSAYNLEALRSEISQQKGKRQLLLKQREELTGGVEEMEQRALEIEEAQAIIQVVAQSTQQELEFQISEIGSLAMDAIFPQPYKLHLDFALRRGRSEADLSFSSLNSDERLDPMSASGGGPVDVAAFALRVSLWGLQVPRTRNTILLDEPLRFLSEGLQPKASEMMKEISKEMGIQFLIITHETELEGAADRIIVVSKRKKVSRVEIEE